MVTPSDIAASGSELTHGQIAVIRYTLSPVLYYNLQRPRLLPPLAVAREYTRNTRLKYLYPMQTSMGLRFKEKRETGSVGKNQADNSAWYMEYLLL